MPPTEVLWEREPHTAAKHLVLRKYLDRWLPIMATQAGQLAIIDGFAGPGEYCRGEPGSPAIMLDAFLEHAHRGDIERQTSVQYAFVESDVDRHAHLEALLPARVGALPSSWPRPDVRCADFGETVGPMVERLGAREVPTFLFIDPFGYLDPPPELTARLLSFRRCETLTFVPSNYISRFIANPEMEPTFDNFFGRSGWRRARGGSAREVADVVVEEFSARLHEDATWVRTFELQTAEAQLYHLFFATNHERGYQKMKEAMWAVDPAGGSRFSDRTTPGQEVLFSETADMGLLETQLRARFGETGWIRYEVLERFTWFETAYLPKHLKDDLARLEAAGRAKVIERGPHGGWMPTTQVWFVP